MYQETRFQYQDACFLNQEGRRQFLISFVSEGDGSCLPVEGILLFRLCLCPILT